MRRVTRGKIVFLTYDPSFRGFWLADYFPELVTLDEAQMPQMADYENWLGPVDVSSVLIPHDCKDGFLAGYWQRPAAYLDEQVRTAMSSFWAMGDVSEGLHDCPGKRDAVNRDALSSPTPSFPRRRESKQTTTNWAFLATRLDPHLRGDDDREWRGRRSKYRVPCGRNRSNPTDPGRFDDPMLNFSGQSCTCVGMTTESGAAAGRSIESLAAETGAILLIPDALTIQCLIFPDSTARRAGKVTGGFEMRRMGTALFSSSSS